MSQLILEYVLQGARRGYNFTSSTNGFDETTLKTIWRQAMPRGQGWSAPAYTGARSIKAFLLQNGDVAVSEVTVTDLQDENGRRGIRRAVIDVMGPQIFQHHLESRWAGYPAPVHATARKKYDQVTQQMPRLKRDQPLIMASEFTTTQDWWTIEALVLLLVMHPLPVLQRGGDFLTFTTLSLSPNGDSRVVALPQDQLRTAQQVPTVII